MNFRAADVTHRMFFLAQLHSADTKIEKLGKQKQPKPLEEFSSHFRVILAMKTARIKRLALCKLFCLRNLREFLFARLLRCKCGFGWVEKSAKVYFWLDGWKQKARMTETWGGCRCWHNSDVVWGVSAWWLRDGRSNVKRLPKTCRRVMHCAVSFFA